jgi:hypothetical protein
MGTLGMILQGNNLRGMCFLHLGLAKKTKPAKAKVQMKGHKKGRCKCTSLFLKIDCVYD